MVFIYGRRDGDNMKRRFAEPRGVCGKINARPAYLVVADFAGRIDSALILFDFFQVQVKPDDVKLFRKSDGDRHTDVAEADQRQFIFFVEQTLIQIVNHMASSIR